jgi:transcriptional regulator with XRE-family HTH domain
VSGASSTAGDPDGPDSSPVGGADPDAGDPAEVGPDGRAAVVDLGEFIREQRRLGRLSLRKLSELSGISNPYLSQIERGLRKPSADILKEIARALSISVESLYVRAGILEPRLEPSSVIDEIERDPDLDGTQKRALIHIYQSFRQAHAADGDVSGKRTA